MIRLHPIRSLGLKIHSHRPRTLVNQFAQSVGGNWNFEVEHRVGRESTDPTISYATQLIGFELKGNDAFDDSFLIEPERGQFQLTESGHATGFTPNFRITWAHLRSVRLLFSIKTVRAIGKHSAKEWSDFQTLMEGFKTLTWK